MGVDFVVALGDTEVVKQAVFLCQQAEPGESRGLSGSFVYMFDLRVGANGFMLRGLRAIQTMK